MARLTIRLDDDQGHIETSVRSEFGAIDDRRHISDLLDRAVAQMRAAVTASVED